jgi:threonine dehydrogenase-like Zn-dependent dehydrogenase
MRAITWQGKKDIRCEEVPEPEIEEPRDAIVKVTSCAICGSDLHLMNGFIPTMCKGDVLGHEFMGEVVEIGSQIVRLKVGDKVVVPFTIWCGECEQCRRGQYSVCQNSNRNAELAEKFYGYTTAGLFGYSAITGSYAGGQAEFVRVPYADNGPVVVPKDAPDDQVLFLGDILPTGWQAAAQAEVGPGDTVAVWGAGPVGLFAIQSAKIMGAEKIIVVEKRPERIAMARRAGATDVVDYSRENVLDRLRDLTDGKGPRRCIDCVGIEADGGDALHTLMDRTFTAMKLETSRPIALREAIMACQPGGNVSVAGVYGGVPGFIPFGAAFQKGLTFRMGQTHVNRWADDLLRRVLEGEIDTTFMITHRGTLEDGPELYRTFRDKQDGCVKVVLTP